MPDLDTGGPMHWYFEGPHNFAQTGIQSFLALLQGDQQSFYKVIASILKVLEIESAQDRRGGVGGRCK